jgi:NTE family protein
MLNFMKIDALMSETVDIKDELKRDIELEARAGASL